MVNKLAKKEILGGEIRKVKTISPIDGKPMEVELEASPDYSPDKIKSDLSKYGLEPIKEVEVVDPITNKRSIVTIDRTGTHEGKLIVALADKSLSREQKDSVLSMYLWERGKENASLLVDLMRYKGAHTKETRAFTSQMRFDFEMFVTLFVGHMRGLARETFVSYGIASSDIKDFCDKYLKAVNEARKDNVEFDITQFEIFKNNQSADRSLLLNAIRNWTEADAFEARVARITEARQKEKGFGIYVDRGGRPYSIFTDDKVDEIVKADMERIKNLNEDEKHE